MNPWYLIAAALGFWGVTRLASSSGSAAIIAAAIAEARAVLSASAAAQANGTWTTWSKNAYSSIGKALLDCRRALPLAGGSDQATLNGLISQLMTLLSQAYANLPTSVKRSSAQESTAFTLASWQAAQQGTPSAPSGTQSVTDLINKANAIINSFPSPGSDASAYIAWTASSAFQVPGLISDLQNAISAIQSGSATGDVSMLTTLVAKLGPLVAQAASAAASGSGSSSSDGTDSGVSTEPSTDQSGDQGAGF